MDMAAQTTKRQELFRNLIKDVVRKRIASKAELIDNSFDLPNETINVLRDNRLFGLLVPKDSGGEGATFREFCIMVEELSKACPALSILCTTQNISSRVLLSYGTDQQKKSYLPRMIAGDAFCGLALDESADLRGIPVVEGTSRDDNYVIRGDKKFVVNGDLAKFFVILLPTDSRGLNCLIVDKDIDSLTVAKVDEMKGSEARYATELKFNECMIAKRNLLGEEYKGKLILQEFLPELACANAARAVGIAQAALEYSTDYSKRRIQFGTSISSFQQIQVMISEMVSNVEASKTLLHRAADLIDLKEKGFSILGYVAKAFASDAAMKTTTSAVQICGGYGYMRDYPVERMMRNAKICQMSELRHERAQLLIAKSFLGENV
jgi:butyryl-CoA dehydrogenase